MCKRKTPYMSETGKRFANYVQCVYIYKHMY